MRGHLTDCCCSAELAQARPLTVSSLTTDDSKCVTRSSQFAAQPGHFVNILSLLRSPLPCLSTKNMACSACVMRLLLRANKRTCVVTVRKLYYPRRVCCCYYFNQFSFPSHPPNAFPSKSFLSIHPTPVQASQQKLETSHSFT